MVVLLLGSLIALAPEVTPTAQDPDVQEAVRRYDALDYRAVIPLLERALSRPGLRQQDRVIALAYVGRTHAVFHAPVKAQVAFERLLAVAPDYAIGDHESPLIREAFSRARANALASDGPGEATAPMTATTPAAAEGSLSTLQAALISGASVVVVLATATGVAVLALRPWETSSSPGGTLGRWTLP